ncbi:MAG: Rieske 2Fe-2S domain-containing protein, partial [Betaproteobacteria bacterium]|nr:Rieske 2Fe-2S domain-containing protein [Betaproteobacteria bacterium]
MTTAQESETLVRIGPGTAMGKLMRQYWVPACLASELQAGGAPMRLLLLGEKLVAFRDAQGRVGIMDHRCPHRCASLFFGRTDEDGIRCVYHGWKFDVNGQCLEMPNLPPEQDFSHKVKARAYPVRERNGLVWTYMGPRDTPPPLPQFEPTLLDGEAVAYRVFQRECNWLQALEGDIDTSHFGFLHTGAVDVADLNPEEPSRYVFLHRAPEYYVQESPFGTSYCAHRPAGPGETHYRVAHFLFPFWTYPPEGNFGDNIISQAWVPMDDTHTMVFHITWNKRTPPPRAEGRQDHPGPGEQVRVPAQHPRLVRPLALRGQPRQRLPARPRGAGHQQLLGHHRGVDPGPGHHREHGRHHRPHLGTPRAQRPHDHRHAPQAAQGRAGAGQGRHRAAAGRRPRNRTHRARRLVRGRDDHRLGADLRGTEEGG